MLENHDLRWTVDCLCTEVYRPLTTNSKKKLLKIENDADSFTT